MEPANDLFSKFGALLKNFRGARKLRQLDLAVALPVDSTIVSKWENGLLFPTQAQLFSIRTELALKDEEFESLYFAWKREAQAVNAAFQFGGERLDALIDFLRTSITSVRHLRNSGQPHVAMMLCERDVTVALERIRSVTWSDLHLSALTHISELLVEQCKAGLDFLPRHSVRQGAVDGVLRALRDVHHACDGDATKFFIDLAKEGSTYVAGDVDAAFVQSMDLLNVDQIIPEAWRPEVLRAAAINAGKVGNRPALELVEQQIERLLDDINEDASNGHQAFLLEGLARGWSKLDPEKGTEIILSAFDIREKGSDSNTSSLLRHVQLVRTEAEIASADLTGVDKKALAKKIKEAIAISKQHGYDRYVGQLQDLLTLFS